MNKVGRNDVCPCGSGKKYKKCCMSKGETSIVNNSAELTYGVVNRLSRDEIIFELRKMGIPFEEKGFLEDIEKFYSAEQLSENWLKQHAVKAKDHEGNFLRLAAQILWERLGPENVLSREQMAQLMDEGFESLKQKDSIVACDKWLEVWEALKCRINPKDKKLDYLEKQYKKSFFISNLYQDLEMELYKAGQDNPEYIEKRIKFCREVCEYFPGENPHNLHNLRRAMAESYAQLGDYEQAEMEFQKLVQEYPNNPWGYIGWGDIYFFEAKKDYEKAQVYYEKALSIAKDEMDILSVNERLEDLKKIMQKQ